MSTGVRSNMFAETCLQWQKQQQKHFHFQLHCLGFENLQKLQQKKQCIFDCNWHEKIRFRFVQAKPKPNDSKMRSFFAFSSNDTCQCGNENGNGKTSSWPKSFELCHISKAQASQESPTLDWLTLWSSQRSEESCSEIFGILYSVFSVVVCV